MNQAHDYIAVFDSGVGGISVLRHLRRMLPGERFVYYGDSANAPYGTRPTEEVRSLTFAAVEYLQKHYPLKALVIACNTATAAAVNEIRAACPGFIVVGIEPALKVAADHFPGGRIGVLATEVTLLHRFDENVTIYKIPVPGLVELVEAGKVDTPETEAVLRRALNPYVGKLDAAVLGCTHYPFARAAISRILGKDVVLLDGGEGTARETRRRLEAAGLLENGSGETIICSSSPDPDMLRLSWERLNQEDYT